MRLPDGSGPFTLLLREGLIAEIQRGPIEPGRAVPTLDGGGGVVLPRFVDAHMHLDKTLLGEPWIPLPEARTLEERIVSGERIIRGRTRRTVAERSAALAASALAHGTLALRTHADVTPGLGLGSVEVLLELRRKLAGVLDLQIVAFPQAGLVSPATVQLLDEALRMGADVLGGLDPADGDADADVQLEALFALACRHDVPLDIHLHEHGVPGLRTLDRICSRTAAAGLGGRVAVSHAFALGDAGAEDAAPTLERLASAGVAIITAATGHTAIPRAHDLWAAGVRLGVGSDNVHDSWWPYGRGDVLEKAFLLAYRNGLRTDAELHRALDAITRVNAEILGLPARRIEPGAPADLVVVDAENGAEAVAAHPPRRIVMRAGRVVPAYVERSRPTTSA